MACCGSLGRDIRSPTNSPPRQLTWFCPHHTRLDRQRLATDIHNHSHRQMSYCVDILQRRRTGYEHMDLSIVY